MSASIVSPTFAVPSASGSQTIWLRIGTLLDGTSTQPRKNASVVYNGSGVLFVGDNGAPPPRELLRAGQAAPDVDAPDATLLPGLIEAHAHLFLEGGELNADKRAAYL